jgi:hypothetical protein
LGWLRGVGAAGRLAAMRGRGEWLTVQTELNKLLDEMNLTRSMDSSQLASWLTAAKSMKYGAVALRMARSPQLAEVIEDLRNLSIKLNDAETRKRLTNCEEQELKREGGRGISILSTMSAAQHMLDPTLAKVLDDPSVTLPQLLYAYGMTGVGIRVRRSEASNINPWAIGVDYVSSDYFDTTSVMCAIDSKHELTLIDLHREPITDVLVLQDPELPLPNELWRCTKLAQIYTSVVATRNLELYQGAQQMAINAAALTKAIDQLRLSKFRTRRHFDTILHIIHNLHRQTQIPAMAAYWKETAEKMITADEPGNHMTEADGDDIASINKLIVALITQPSITQKLFTNQKDDKSDCKQSDGSDKQSDGSGKQSDGSDKQSDGSGKQSDDGSQQWSRVARGVVAESISRMARLFARYWWFTTKGKQPADPLDVDQLMLEHLAIDTRAIPVATADSLLPSAAGSDGILDKKVLDQCRCDAKVATSFADRLLFAEKRPGTPPGPQTVINTLLFITKFHQSLTDHKSTIDHLINELVHPSPSTVPSQSSVASTVTTATTSASSAVVQDIKEPAKVVGGSGGGGGGGGGLIKDMWEGVQTMFAGLEGKVEGEVWSIFLKQFKLPADLMVGLPLHGLRYHQSSSRRNQTGWCKMTGADIIRSLEEEAANRVWQQRLGLIRTQIRGEEERQRSAANERARNEWLKNRTDGMFHPQFGANWYALWPFWCRPHGFRHTPLK